MFCLLCVYLLSSSFWVWAQSAGWCGVRVLGSGFRAFGKRVSKWVVRGHSWVPTGLRTCRCPKALEDLLVHKRLWKFFGALLRVSLRVQGRKYRHLNENLQAELQLCKSSEQQARGSFTLYLRTDLWLRAVCP